MTDVAMSPEELSDLAGARFGSHWPAKLAAHMTLSRAAVLRWKKEGVNSPERATQIRAAIEREGPVPKIAVPTREEFKTWRIENFGTAHSAARELGLDVDTILALESGITRKGNVFPIKPWVTLMMAGTLKKDSSRKGPSPHYRHQRDLARTALEKGATLAEAAQVGGLSVQYLEKLQRQDDLPRSARSRRRKFDQSPRNVDKKKVIERALAGEPYRSIAEDFGVTVARIGHIALAAGIVRRPRKSKNADAK